ncbi:MAG: glucosamine-6-phosphate deaminase [Dehalococcoidia bacterium]
MRIEIVDVEQFASAAAGVLCETVRARPQAVLGLPSGHTPTGMYRELGRRVAAGEIDVSGARGFAIDELYGVPNAHPATNATYFRERVDPALSLHKLVMDSATPDWEVECARFVSQIAEAGGLDLAVLGIGRNGHLAFNEPGSAFDSVARRVALTRASREAYAAAFGSLESTPAYGLTLGLADLMAARSVLLLAGGASKAGPVALALEGPVTEDVPASVLQRHADVTVLLDREAAANLVGTDLLGLSGPFDKHLFL